jgi:D-3-phosphoglycerate dehydrogenase
MQKILFIDPVHPLIGDELTRMGYQCDVVAGASREVYLQIAGQYEGVIVRSGTAIDREFIGHAPLLKFIGRVGAGMEGIDMDFALSKGIACLNSPEGNRDAVAEHALGMLLSLMNNLHRADRQVRSGKWLREENRGCEILGKTVGIIGYGNMGGAFARRLSGFGAQVISYDKYKVNYADSYTREVTLDEIFNESDIVSLHVPLTPETRNMCDDAFIVRFSKSIWLINTSRGQVVQTSSLVKGLENNKILGAALDVLEYENTTFESLMPALPVHMEYLLASDRVILTPHIAGWTHESNIRLATVLVEKIRNCLILHP